jgi:hypothetical protein
MVRILMTSRSDPARSRALSRRVACGIGACDMRDGDAKFSKVHFPIPKRLASHREELVVVGEQERELIV